MLMSAGLALPQSVFSHGFVNAADGRKMSKSYDNAVDPNEILDKYACDSIRYYFCSSITYGADISFSESALVTMHNSELADILVNKLNSHLSSVFLCMHVLYV
jgi:methionyl-tRNA synthetase